MKKNVSRGPKSKVVIVDDHDIVREGLRLWLEGIDCVEVVGEARGLREALEVVRAAGPDLVLMDVVMPDGNGLEGVELITRDHPAVRVIILTGYSEDEYVHQALRAGASGYVLKDASYTDLELAVLAVRQGGLYLSPAASRSLVKARPASYNGDAPGGALTRRQNQILKLLAEGHSVKSIGHQLGISAKTVDMHKSRLMQRLNLSNLPSLVRYAIQHKLVEL